MHIPDGYLSPETCLAMYAATVPFWHRASARLKRVLASRAAPLLAILAAFSFTIQMFNLPVPGGTTAHAVGGTLIAIVLGPSAAIVGVTVALIIQALFFGDGGITALGANAFNLAVALPLAGYGVYRLLARGHPSDRRRVIAAAIAGYAGINVAGLLVALELGIQPLFWSAGGQALYNPYGLAVTLPVMAFTHLTVAGFAEAGLTALAVAYLLKAQRSLIAPEPTAAVVAAPAQTRRLALLVPIVILMLLAPLGLLASGSADFEWGREELASLVGYVPAGIAALGPVWSRAPVPDYGLASGAFFDQAIDYVLSAALGVGLIFVVLFAVRLAPPLAPLSVSLKGQLPFSTRWKRERGRAVLGGEARADRAKGRAYISPSERGGGKA